MPTSSWRFTTSGGADISVGELLVVDVNGGNLYVTDNNDPTQTVYRLPYFAVGGGESVGTPVGISSSDSDALGSGVGNIAYNSALGRDLVLSDFNGFCVFVNFSGSIILGAGVMLVGFGINTATIVSPNLGSGMGLVWGSTIGTPSLNLGIINIGYIDANAYSIASQSYAPPPVDSSYQAPPAPVSF